MGQPAAKQGDMITATDTHVVIVQGSPTPLPHPFSGIIDGSLSSDVKVMGMPAAVAGSTATNSPPHLPQGGPFQSPPSNRGTIESGSGTVKVNGKGFARNGDTAMTCNDPADMPVGTVVAGGTVLVG